MKTQMVLNSVKIKKLVDAFTNYVSVATKTNQLDQVYSHLLKSFNIIDSHEHSQDVYIEVRLDSKIAITYFVSDYQCEIN
jgi:hypothetical protein